METESGIMRPKAQQKKEIRSKLRARIENVISNDAPDDIISVLAALIGVVVNDSRARDASQYPYL